MEPRRMVDITDAPFRPLPAPRGVHLAGRVVSFASITWLPRVDQRVSMIDMERGRVRPGRVVAVDCGRDTFTVTAEKDLSL